MRLVNVHQPTAATLIALILPHRTNVLLEQRIIVSVLQIGRHANMVVETPEVLHRIEAGDLVLHIFPGLCPVNLQIPERPLVLQRMLDETLLGDFVLGIDGDWCVTNLFVDDGAVIRLGFGLHENITKTLYKTCVTEIRYLKIKPTTQFVSMHAMV